MILLNFYDIYREIDDSKTSFGTVVRGERTVSTISGLIKKVVS